VSAPKSVRDPGKLRADISEIEKKNPQQLQQANKIFQEIVKCWRDIDELTKGGISG
jgi:hypothetical protein